jgi:ATP-dependent DNA helicase RecQ
MKSQSMLKDVFGFDNFRHGQEEVVDSILKDHSTLAIFLTGAGKSMCYQLPL